MSDTDKLIAEARGQFPTVDEVRTYPLDALRLIEGLVAALEASRTPAPAPHSYQPDVQAMGDCLICGNTPSSHAPLTPAEGEAETALALNYCPEHGDLLARPGDGRDVRSWRCREAHDVDEICSTLARRSPVETEENLARRIFDADPDNEGIDFDAADASPHESVREWPAKARLMASRLLPVTEEKK